MNIGKETTTRLHCTHRTVTQATVLSINNPLWFDDFWMSQNNAWIRPCCMMPGSTTTLWCLDPPLLHDAWICPCSMMPGSAPALWCLDPHCSMIPGSAPVYALPGLFKSTLTHVYMLRAYPSVEGIQWHPFSENCLSSIQCLLFNVTVNSPGIS